MRKIITAIFLIILLLLTRPVWAQNIAGSSASVISSNNRESINLRNELYVKKMAIKTIMEKYNSPMIEAIDGFMYTCTKYELDCYLLPSIAILESTFGQHIYPESHNPFGWGGGYIMFDTWEDGIEAVGKGLRENYLDKGAVTIDQIAPIYATSPTWAVRVKLIKKMFEAAEAKNQLYFGIDAVQL